MEKPISLSVVVCTYNGAKYLQPQLESLLRQTLMPTEILIHDDGSTDGTLDIAHAYAELIFPAIRQHPTFSERDKDRLRIFEPEPGHIHLFSDSLCVRGLHRTFRK